MEQYDMKFVEKSKYLKRRARKVSGAFEKRAPEVSTIPTVRSSG